MRTRSFISPRALPPPSSLTLTQLAWHLTRRTHGPSSARAFQVAPASLLAQSASDVGVAWRGAVQRVEVDSGVSAASSAGSDGEEDPDAVPLWPDVLQWPLHPSSEVIVRQYRARDAVTPFNRYSQGDAIAADQAFIRSFDDSVHFFLEECDRPQGVQLIVDTHDAFAGLGSRLAEMLRDDHGKVCDSPPLPTPCGC